MEKVQLSESHTEDGAEDLVESDEEQVESGEEQECLHPQFLGVGQRLFVGSHGGPLPRGQAVQVIMITGGGARGAGRCLVVPLREGGPRRSDWFAEGDLCLNPPEN